MRCRVWAMLVLVLAACAEPESTPAAEAAPDTLAIRCDGETTDVLTSIVQARRDGVHVLIHNTSVTERLSVTWEGGGDGASPGDTTLVFPINPGPSRIRCLKETGDNGAENGDWGRFEVLAPEGWVSPQLECPGLGYGGSADYGPGARGVSDPVADAPQHFRHSGTVVQAGYETAGIRTVINIVDGAAKESLEYTSDGSGGWLLTGTSGCSD